MRIAALAGVTALAVTVLACQDSASSSSESETARTGGIFGGAVQSTERGSTDWGSTDRGSTEAASPGTRPVAGEMSIPEGSLGAVGESRVPVSEIPPGEPVDVSDMGFTVGSAEAPIRVIEFSDFGCGYCRRFHLETYPTIHREYVQTGRVAWKYLPFVLGIFPNGEAAAIAGECVLEQGPEGFPGFRDSLFADQDGWKSASDPTDHFVRVAETQGVDEARLRRCIAGEETASQVADNIALGRRVGVRGTPAFLVDGVPLQGAHPTSTFRAIFDQLLANEGANR